LLRIILAHGLIVNHVQLYLVNSLIIHALPVCLDSGGLNASLSRYIDITVDILDALLLVHAFVWALLARKDLLSNDIGI